MLASIRSFFNHPGVRRAYVRLRVPIAIVAVILLLPYLQPEWLLAGFVVVLLGLIAIGVFLALFYLGFLVIFQIDIANDPRIFWITFAIMGVIGLSLAMLVNVFVRSSGLDLIISLIGVAIFTALTASDTQQIARWSNVPQIAGGGEAVVGRLKVASQRREDAQHSKVARADALSVEPFRLRRIRQRRQPRFHHGQGFDRPGQRPAGRPFQDHDVVLDAERAAERFLLPFVVEGPFELPVGGHRQTDRPASRLGGGPGAVVIPRPGAHETRRQEDRRPPARRPHA